MSAFAKKFEDWLRAKGNKDTTISFQLRTLRATFNRAIEAKIVAQDKNPFPAQDIRAASLQHE